MTNHPITYSTIVARLEENAIGHRTLTLDDGSLLLVSQRGARIYGPFRGADAESENWVPTVFAEPDAFARFIDSGHWNIGGERLWIGPEIQYMIPDRTDYWGTYVMQPAMDPGVHEFDGSGGTCTLTLHAELDTFTLASGQVDLDLEISVHLAAHPLRFVSTYADELRHIAYAGYTQRVCMAQGPGSDAVSESWNLVQVRSGGQVIVPATPRVEVTDYYEPVGDLLTQIPGAVITSITGAQRYKLGFKAPHVNGRAGYVRMDADGQGALLIRNVGNDPSSVYTEEPDAVPGTSGDSIHIYNDDGGLGGFGEVESRGRTIAGDTGRRSSEDEFTSWWFFGTVSELRLIGEHMLGVDIFAAAPNDRRTV